MGSGLLRSADVASRPRGISWRGVGPLLGVSLSSWLVSGLRCDLNVAHTPGYHPTERLEQNLPVVAIEMMSHFCLAHHPLLWQRNRGHHLVKRPLRRKYMVQRVETLSLLDLSPYTPIKRISPCFLCFPLRRQTHETTVLSLGQGRHLTRESHQHKITLHVKTQAVTCDEQNEVPAQFAAEASRNSCPYKLNDR